jgi:hypothetical protein
VLIGLVRPRYYLLSLAVSLIIFGVIYFTVIRPDNNAANTAVRSSEQQAVQAVQSVNKQTGGAVPASVTNLTACIAAAGTNATQLQACQAKFKP